MTNRRLDKGQFARVRKTPQGGIRVDAGLTRVGILTYRNPDGSPRLEFRPPEEVFRADSLESLAGAPVLDGHSTWVTPETFSTHARGHVVEGTPRKDGELVAAELVVQDAGTLDRVERRDLAELSMGYTCDYVPGEGTWNGQRYDGVQTNIRYNHVALLPAGTGRAGRDCALRLDALEPADVGAPAASTDPARASLVASIKLLDPSFRADGLSTEYLAGVRDYLEQDGSGVFSDGHRMALEHVREVRGLAGERREAPGIREDGTFSYADVQRAAGEHVREAWRESATERHETAADTREDARNETREDGPFSADDIRQQSHDAVRNAWREGSSPQPAPRVVWEGTPGGTFMARV